MDKFIKISSNRYIKTSKIDEIEFHEKNIVLFYDDCNGSSIARNEETEKQILKIINGGN